MNHSPVYIDVILPLGVPNLYTYVVPEELVGQLGIGYRVVVQFGKSKLYTAIVTKIHEQQPNHYSPKEVQLVLDDYPVVNEIQLRFWDWIKSYYMCHPGDVMNAALPGGLKLSSETQIVLNTEQEYNPKDLSDDEYLVFEALEMNTVLSLDEISAILQRKTTYPVIKSLLSRGLVHVVEEIKTKFLPKIEKYVRLHPSLNLSDLPRFFDQLEKAPKQLELLMKFVELSRILTDQPSLVKKTILLESCSASSAQLKSLETKEILEVQEITVGRLGEFSPEENSSFDLSPTQKEGLKHIEDQFSTKDVVLLQGVTSSGKTEMYIRLIEQVINEGKQVLYLLPEIALTTQIISRLRKYFGDDVGVYHSRFNQNERVEVWNKQISTGGYKIILGARSAVFLPFSNLGLVIIDEEHDASFKQFEPAPRYHSRDSGIVLAHMYRAKVLLGSATPSLETMHNARSGKYGIVQITERFGGVKMPQIILSDLRYAHKMKQMKGHFSQALVDEITKALENKEQIILFQNRRGFSPYVVCKVCGWTPQCNRCDVSLTYHKYLHILKCHYCGFENYMPKKCEACGSHEVELSGFGTEKIEEDLEIMFPDARIARMDLETTRAKNAYQQLISDFEENRIDILVGTQMVTKGLDFENVSLVGVLNADQSLNFQDFRAHERSFQLLSQVAGRAGRSKKQGLVIIQTYQPDHPILQQVIAGDYNGMYERETSLREEYHYPPYFKLIRITLKNVSKEKLEDAAHFFASQLRILFGSRVLGPEFPPIPRIRNKYLNQLFVKVENESSIQQVKKMLSDTIDSFRIEKSHSSTQVIVDIDPY